MRGVFTTREEFLFPDMELGSLPKRARTVMPRNGRPGVQALFETKGGQMSCSLKGGPFRAEWFELRKVPVEYNTASGDEQGGAMVLVPEEKPDYAVRKAPFYVYDCLKPAPDGVVREADGRCGVYFCLVPEEDIQPGRYELEFQAALAEETYVCSLEVQVYDVEIPNESFPVTNWFSLDAIFRCHQEEPGSEAFFALLDQYIAQMRRVRQNTFYIELDQRCVRQTDPYVFDFEYLYPVISRFFAGGMRTLEIGPVLSRGFLPSGAPDMYTNDFRCAMAPQVDLETAQGYEITTAYLKALAAFLEKYGWQDQVIVHVHDEPDVHYLEEQGLDARRRQYYMAGHMVKTYLPKARIIEAVKTTEFRGGVDIWVPVTSSYEEEKAAFDRFAGLGEEIWTYVCCVPEGKWLNRFLDQKVDHSRLLFWGFERNRLSGYLHWGFNQFPEGMDPFQATSCYNPTGLGSNFPCGDAFIVYPGDDGPWPSLRLEAERRGTEDLELLRMLGKEERELCDQLIGKVFTDNTHYVDDEDVMAAVYEELLQALEKAGQK